MDASQKGRIANQLRQFGDRVMEVAGCQYYVSGYIYDMNIFMRDFDLELAEGMSEDPSAEKAWAGTADFIVASNNFLDIFGSDEEAPEIEAGYEQLARVFEAIRKGPESLGPMRDVISKYLPDYELLAETAPLLPFRQAFESEVNQLIAALRSEHGLA
jgi:hypothetical protein